MTEAEIRQHLGDAPWAILTTPWPGQHPRTRQELTRRFRFASFPAAIGFMRDAVPHIDRMNHHPRWENVFNTVTVWLATWAAGHAVSQQDIDLARYLDSLYAKSEAGATTDAANAAR